MSLRIGQPMTLLHAIVLGEVTLLRTANLPTMDVSTLWGKPEYSEETHQPGGDSNSHL